MVIPLLCRRASPVLPTVRPGDTAVLSRVGSELVLTLQATPFLLQALLAAITAGDVEATGTATPDELMQALQAVMVPPLQVAG